MGRIDRSGYGFGMTEKEAMRDFIDNLNRTYGEELYQGGGNDIRDWKKSKCVEKPINGKPSKRTKVSSVEKKEAKLINGFLITNYNDSKRAIEIFQQKSINEVIKLATTQTEAKQLAKELAIKHNDTFFISPCRLWKDKYGKISQADIIFTVEPSGGTKAKLGKWYFEVECAY